MINIVVWVLQVLPGSLFFYSGSLHFTVPPDLPAQMAWMYELPAGLHYFAGAAEILAGLILPGLTRLQTRLTPLAALGLAFVMAGAAVWQGTRNAAADVIGNISMLALEAQPAQGQRRCVASKGGTLNTKT